MKKYMGEDEVIKLNEALAKGRTYTVAEIKAMPEDVRVELIDGVVYYQATPTVNHQALLSFLNILDSGFAAGDDHDSSF